MLGHMPDDVRGLVPHPVGDGHVALGVGNLVDVSHMRVAQRCIRFDGLEHIPVRIGGHGTGVCPDRAVIGVLHGVEQHLRHRLRIIVRLPAGRGRQQQRQCHQCGEATVDVLHAVLPCLSACPSTFIFQYRPYCGRCCFVHGARAMVGNIDVEAFDVWESYGLRTCADG